MEATIESAGKIDALEYSREYPDVAWSGLSPQEHYRRFGKVLGRLVTERKERSALIPSDIDYPRVSIVCISYNQERFVEQAICSIQNQITDFPIEIIIVDDCSTDQTASVIENLVAKDPRVKFIARTKNVGSSSNFGEALALAKGEYVAICEGDDYWTDNRKLQLQVDYLDENQDCSICFHPVVVEFENGQESEIFPADRGPFNARRLAFGNFIQTNSVMYRWRWQHGEFAKVYSPEIAPSDWFLHLQHAETGGIGFIDRPMAVYRKHSGGIWWGAGSLVHRLRHGAGEMAFFRGLSTLFGGAFSEHGLQVRLELATQLARHHIVSNNPAGLRQLLKVDREATLLALDGLSISYLGVPFDENINGPWNDLIEVPSVSVIVLTYNHAETIEQCLRSVLCQQGPIAMELIVGDDFSTDETRAIIGSVLDEQHNSIKVKILPADKNRGMQENLRRCMEAATGEYIAFCEGDDYWLSPLKIIKQVLCLKSDPSLAMCFNWILLENQVENSLYPHPQQGEITKQVISQHEIFENPVTANFSCCMYRASCLSGIDDRYYDTKDAADWLFNLIASSTGQIGFIRELLSVYRIHSGGQWSKLLPSSQKIAFEKAQRRAKDILGDGLKARKHKVQSYKRRLPPALRACLDRPGDGLIFLEKGRLVLSGWVVDDRNRRIVLVIKHGNELYHADLNEFRGDVPSFLGEDHLDPKCGFNISLDPKSEGIIDIEVQAGAEAPVPWQRIRYVPVTEAR